MNLIKIQFAELPEQIKIAFAGDNDLAEKYHEINKDIDTCILETIERIKQSSEVMDLSYYKVCLKGESIGFVVVANGLGIPVLYSFGINIKHRCKKVLMKWFDVVKDTVGDIFVSIIWSKNKRAIDFLKKNGMIQISSENNCVTLATKNLLPCQ